MSNGSDWYTRPELIFADLIGKAARGEDRDRQHYHRAVVVAVDLDGGVIQNSSGNGSISVLGQDGKRKTFKAVPGPDSPRGSVKARVLTAGLDRLLSDDDLRVFWPMFPPDQVGLPVSPGEHVYVVFEGTGMDKGLWISRVPGQDSANSFKGSDSYVAPSAPRSAMDFFEPNTPEYQLTDEHAGDAQPSSAMKFFDGTD